jgi:glucose-1-phosphate thymidylyltransferase
MKGIVLAGGSGTRLYPITRVVSKQFACPCMTSDDLLPASVLMLAGIREVLIISTPADLPRFGRCWATASSSGCHWNMPSNPARRGWPQAFHYRPAFHRAKPGGLDSWGTISFMGMACRRFFSAPAGITTGASFLATWSATPSATVWFEFDPSGRVLSIEEKPARPKSRSRGRPVF